jgi:YHYH protein
LLFLGTAALQATPIDLTSWRINTTGAKGHSTDPTINSLVSQITADVRQVWYTSGDVYVKASGVPSYNVGPFLDGNPAYPSDRNWLFEINRNPHPAAAGTNTATPLGPIGVFVNGVPLFNPKDANSYNNQNVWHNNAPVVEASGFDAALGHPAPVMGSSRCRSPASTTITSSRRA